MKTYIFGHKKPDTDSITSAIALSYLENTLGNKTEPRALGTLNKETKYALEYFNIKEPKYLNDVKLQMKDVLYHKGFMVKDTDPIFDGYQKMIAENLTGLPVTDYDNNFIGLVTMKDLTKVFINDTINSLHTSYDNILHVLDGEEICRFDEEIEGSLVVSAYRSTTFINTVKLDPNKILIVGDRHSIIEYAVSSSIKLIIISGSGHIKDEHIQIAKDNKVNIIRSSYDSYRIAKLISLANYIKTMITSYNPIKFDEEDYIDDVLEINEKLKHTNYPIVDRNNKCLGLFKIIDLSDKNPKKVILVDHNEKTQSVDGIDEAEIIKIIDHHNLGNITTKAPINFRNMSVGSTNTIIYTLYKEKNIPIPKEVAGIMLSGILSDTLILKSPTQTELDKEAVLELSKIAGVDYEEYGLKLLKAGTSLEGMSEEDVIYNDFKLFSVNDKTFGIGQFMTMNFTDIYSNIDKYIEALDKIKEANEYDMVLLYVTDIIRGGSYIIYNSKAKNNLELAYNLEDIPQGYYFDNCVSRKKHIVPIIMGIY